MYAACRDRQWGLLAQTTTVLRDIVTLLYISHTSSGLPNDTAAVGWGARLQLFHIPLWKWKLESICYIQCSSPLSWLNHKRGQTFLPLKAHTRSLLISALQPRNSPLPGWCVAGATAKLCNSAGSTDKLQCLSSSRRTQGWQMTGGLSSNTCPVTPRNHCGLVALTQILGWFYLLLFCQGKWEY